MLTTITAGLKGLTIAQKIGGAIAGLALWLLPAALVWAFMYGKLDAKYELGYRTAEAACSDARADANAQALKEHKAAMATVLEQARADAAELAASLTAARKRADRIATEFDTYVLANPLPAGCFADPERRRLFNEARRPR